MNKTLRNSPQISCKSIFKNDMKVQDEIQSSSTSLKSQRSKIIDITPQKLLKDAELEFGNRNFPYKSKFSFLDLFLRFINHQVEAVAT